MHLYDVRRWGTYIILDAERSYYIIYAIVRIRFENKIISHSVQWNMSILTALKHSNDNRIEFSFYEYQNIYMYYYLLHKLFLEKKKYKKAE